MLSAENHRALNSNNLINFPNKILGSEVTEAKFSKPDFKSGVYRYLFLTGRNLWIKK